MVMVGWKSVVNLDIFLIVIFVNVFYFIMEKVMRWIMINKKVYFIFCIVRCVLFKVMKYLLIKFFNLLKIF